MDTTNPKTVFAEVNGRLCSRCVLCAAWTPLADQSKANAIRIGRIRRIANPNFQVPGHPKQFEETIWVPQVRVGAGCDECQALYAKVKAENPSAREPFIKIKEFPTHLCAPRR